MVRREMRDVDDLRFADHRRIEFGDLRLIVIIGERRGEIAVEQLVIRQVATTSMPLVEVSKPLVK